MKNAERKIFDRKQVEYLLSFLKKYVTPQDSVIAFPLCAGCVKKYTFLGKEKWFDWDKDFLFIDFRNLNGACWRF